MKRRVGDRGRRATVRASERTEMEDLCSKLTSLVPQKYRLDTASQGWSDMPSQLMEATTYIRDLRERVERLRQRRDECRSKVQRATGSGSINAVNTAAAAGSCGPHDLTVKFSGATHFDMNFMMSSTKGVQLHKVIRTIMQDQRVEVIEANSSCIDDSKISYVLKCKAVSSEVVLDASMVTTSLKKTLMESFAEPNRLGV